MTRLAVDLNVVARVGQVVAHALLGIKTRAQLIKISELNLGAELHGAAVRSELPEQNLQQRALAAAVGAEQANLVATLYNRGEVADEGALAETLRDVFHFHHQLAALR